MRWTTNGRRAALLVALVALPRSAAAVAPGVVAKEGEVVIFVGDDEIVGAVVGQPALTNENLANVLDRFYQHFSDDYDMVVVSTTFADALNPSAYFTTGIPSPSARSLGFVHMNQVGSWGDLFLPVMTQEFTHAWLVNTRFVDPMTGMVSQELLGRDSAHWSSLVDTEGSFQDGVDWVDHGDGSFTAAGYMFQLSPLDLWTMGFAEDSEVPDFFVLRTPLLSPSVPPKVGLVVSADKIVVSLADVIAAQGPQPPTSARQHDFRVAWVLITEVGQGADEVRPSAALLDTQRRAWSEAMHGWLWERGTACSDVTVDCTLPHLSFVSAAGVEGPGGDGDAVVEPGEATTIDVVWRNSGAAAATGGSAFLAPPAAGWSAPADLPVADVAAGADGASRFSLVVPADAACGVPVSIELGARLGTVEWRGSLELTPGTVEGAAERFAGAADWTGHGAPADTAAAGGFEHGVAERVTYVGRVTQPAGGAAGPEDAAWWTGRAMGVDWKANDLDDGVTTLTSPPLSLGDVRRPTLRYRVWYLALAFGGATPVPALGDDLVVEASDDDGERWVEIDRVSGPPLAWARREAALDGLVDTRRPIRVRFVARDAGDEQNLVEVGIDDVQIIGLSDDCAPATADGGGCGCRNARRGGASDGTTAGVGALVALGLVARRRRRPA